MKTLLFLLFAVLFTACQAPTRIVNNDPLVVVAVSVTTSDAEYATYLLEDSDSQFEFIAPSKAYMVGDSLILASPHNVY